LVKFLSEESKRFAVSNTAADSAESIAHAVYNEAAQTSDDLWYQSENEDDIECDYKSEVLSNMNSVAVSEINDNPREVAINGREIPEQSKSTVQFDPVLNSTISEWRSCIS
jgi:hypothetical protein